MTYIIYHTETDTYLYVYESNSDGYSFKWGTDIELAISVRESQLDKIIEMVNCNKVIPNVPMLEFSLYEYIITNDLKLNVIFVPLDNSRNTDFINAVNLR